MQVRVDFRDNATLYTGFQFGNYFRINRKTNERKYLEVPREIGENPLRFNWEAPFQISRHNQDIVYFASQSVYRSMDKGETGKNFWRFNQKYQTRKCALFYLFQQ